MTGPIVVVGDALLDRDVEGAVRRLCPDAPVPVVEDPVDRLRPGGAGLVATLAAERSDDVLLVTALGADEGGQLLGELLRERGVEMIDLGLDGDTPQKERVRVAGQSLLRIDRASASRALVPMSVDKVGAVREALRQASSIVVADYGRGISGDPVIRRLLAEAVPSVPLVWDPHRRGAAPVDGCWLVTPNADEVSGFVESSWPLDSIAELDDAARLLRSRWGARALAVTRGAEGALLVDGPGPPLIVGAGAVIPSDPCGAGDAFAVGAAEALRCGALLSEAVAAAVARAGDFLANGGSGALLRTVDSADRQLATAAARVAGADAGPERSTRGRLVATGGCFDLLHLGHVELLERARRLGDRLVVCLNSDESVRRLKGAPRPFIPQEERAALLLAMEAVDAVEIFDEDTPAAVLRRLRPDLFVKGGDYAGVEIPEQRLLASWGGRTVVVPYVEGHSTSQILQEVMRHGRAS